jgi:hypothetical protein
LCGAPLAARDVFSDQLDRGEILAEYLLKVETLANLPA